MSFEYFIIFVACIFFSTGDIFDNANDETFWGLERASNSETFLRLKDVGDYETFLRLKDTGDYETFLRLKDTGDYETFLRLKDVDDSDLCPSPGSIVPCTCTVEDYDINIDCSPVRSEDQLRQVFAQNFTGTDARKLTIRDNVFLRKLHDGVFGETQFIEIDIRDTTIDTIESGVFSGSYNRAVKMVFSHNKLGSFPFDEITQFDKLVSLEVSSNFLQAVPKINSTSLVDFFINANLITEIPSDSFENLPFLGRFRARSNDISEIKKGTFDLLQFLREVDLMGNHLTYLPGHTFSLNGTVTSLYLSFNQIKTVIPEAFTGVTSEVSLGSNSLEVLKEGVWRPVLEDCAHLYITDNPLLCLCDIAWLIRNDSLLEKVEKGAACFNGVWIHELDPVDFADCH